MPTDFYRELLIDFAKFAAQERRRGTVLVTVEEDWVWDGVDERLQTINREPYDADISKLVDAYMDAKEQKFVNWRDGRDMGK